MSRLEDLLTNAGRGTQPVRASMAVRKLAASKPLRIFITSLLGMPNAQFREFADSFGTLLKMAQNDILTGEADSELLGELEKVPHFVALFHKISEL